MVEQDNLPVLNYSRLINCTCGLQNTFGELMSMEFDPVEVLEMIKTERSIRRKRTTWNRSKLAKCRSELIKLNEAGASFADLQFWLKKERRIKVVISTIKRYLDGVARDREQR